MERTALLERTTLETKVKLQMNLDGSGQHDIYTGIGFLDHMLTLLCVHGFIDLFVNASGDVEVDSHHTAEDVGIVFGDAIYECLGNKEGIKRYGSAILPMEDALVMCVIDISGRPYLSFEADFTVGMLGNMETDMIREFFREVCTHGGFNLHIKKISGKNNHHVAEAIFKAFAHAFSQAAVIDERIKGVLSSKGTLEGE